MQPVELPLTPAGPITVGPGAPLLLLAGPCVLESAELAREVAVEMQAIAARLGVSYVFKASFDKANRTSLSSFRGPGAEKGLRILARLREELKVPVVSDIHEPAQAELAAEVLDILQIPAFLCRQSDLLVAAARTGKVVNIKKGQFVSPWDMAHAVDKVRAAGGRRILLTERGASFGYNNLVVDMRALPVLRGLGCRAAPAAVRAGSASSFRRWPGRPWPRVSTGSFSRSIRTRTTPFATAPILCRWPGWKGCFANSWPSAQRSLG